MKEARSIRWHKENVIQKARFLTRAKACGQPIDVALGILNDAVEQLEAAYAHCPTPYQLTQGNIAVHKRYPQMGR